jgi:hypothetical protein
MHDHDGHVYASGRAASSGHVPVLTPDTFGDCDSAGDNEIIIRY